MQPTRRTLLAAAGITLLTPTPLLAQRTSRATHLVKAARSQVGVTTIYSQAYHGIDYPNGDFPRKSGACTDVIIRAYRDGLGLDLQKLIHLDMEKAFSAYPKIWGLHATDRNIDHRRVPNMRTFFKRRGAVEPFSKDPNDWLPGDIVTSIIGGKLAHCGIVSDRKTGNLPLLIHNVGAGTREENRLFAWPITGHYRWAV
ncbi:DUF1287 domain-containing protein [Parasphingorhabdus halotolerans]|uniref:DUF1287 domain-containing protein n=1 Tax=Parasphingorhabdus halotolerans TaxID=2725558 RepID=A0A6H2DLW6_9SPHN|nr:DUF1287 domain-containing protein [Parasphingorhabdus halotolerans]QJB68945.1 DUF1287 domain-containing protein [Parasphingorhabdus halotolerans]